MRSIDAFLDVYGMPEPVRSTWRQQVLDQFHYTERADATPFSHGDRYDLGGVTVTVVHLPGHTRGHSGFLVEPDGVLYVADIDLSSFGPYYGDHWSDLEDFERSMDRCARDRRRLVRHLAPQGRHRGPRRVPQRAEHLSAR